MKNQKPSFMNSRNSHTGTPYKIVSVLFWFLFLINSALIVAYYPNPPQWNWHNLFRINGLTLIIWAMVSFFSAVVITFAGKYLIGFRYYYRFLSLAVGFTLSVSLLVFADNVGLLILSWFLMGVFMARLIGVNARWGEAKEAAKYCQRYFLAGTLFLTAGILLLSFYLNQFALTGLTQNLNKIPFSITLAAAFCIIVAAMIQSAMFPFHGWLLSAMTSPTPASALMHAGFVNGAGILLTLLAPLFFLSKTMTLLIFIGGITAIAAQFAKLIQVNIKQQLGCSTTAQMAFMIMECGLGFFNAAIVHLILHGCYKAYLFLSSGEKIQHTSPRENFQKRSKIGRSVLSFLLGIAGAVFFSWTTGKGLKADGGIFLTLIVAITVGQAVDVVLKRQEFSTIIKAIIGPVVFFISIGLYALMYNASTIFMNLPMIDHPEPLLPLQIAFGFMFLIGFIIMKSGIYKNFSWLYVKLVNDSQPYKRTILRYIKTSK